LTFELSIHLENHEKQQHHNCLMMMMMMMMMMMIIIIIVINLEQQISISEFLKDHVI